MARITNKTATEKEDLAATLARNIANVSYEDIPADARESTKKSILDTLGVMAGASGLTPGLRELADLIKESGGREESSIIGFGGKVPAWMAAFVNGAMAHCLDYDDIDSDGPVHPSSPTVPAGFAVAERLGKVSGKKLITAITLGNDLQCRLAISTPRKATWHRTVVFGAFAAATVAGKLLDLDHQGMVDALGLAFCQAAGTMELRFGVGSGIGGMYSAFPAKAGVLSAFMAQRGIAGIKTSMDGRAGLFPVYFDGECDRAVLTRDLGKRFEGVNTGYKAWPACAATHVYIDATLSLLQENAIRARDIEGITAYIGDQAQELCEPLEFRRRPATSIDAKFSIPFTVAVAAAKGRVVIGDYTVQALQDKEVLRMAEKVMPRLDPRFNRGLRGMPPGMVEIKTTAGKTHQKRVDFPYGHPAKPISTKDLNDKFRDCLSYSAKPPTGASVEKVIQMAGDLENVSDVAEMIRLLS
ncbi:MAG: MmgE/PrpD family protein [Chloroflexota bacterium]